MSATTERRPFDRRSASSLLLVALLGLGAGATARLAVPPPAVATTQPHAGVRVVSRAPEARPVARTRAS